ncbi:MAG: hypothetical protein CO097_00215 [Candidatus Infernicultor aquiphilus]|uniref:DNA-binding protein n=1 Tax=Candidatus Infernicultor aquiphilus TaxID=1805029 RepID=A0A1J5GRL2_9BACT|nr:MAG: hypothetical protein AUK42_00450 [Candidatus Atribacteria bacterium CG2_30_33_13]PIX35019.1 MAG: hypothetical protein COZ58_01710 [Candidatus Atribacteria bacterium CG_4_8_14_3_um_filter_34_18]PJB58143.1 MAG: hypothetical protein CO097_00215 [Candidatus Atribacteria bacterium CG_4_9_14_3_um_filter_33_16]
MRKAKKIKLIGLFLVIFVMVMSMASCSGNRSSNSSEKSERYGVNITEKRVVNTKDILANPDEYLDQTVRLEGKIVRECPSGCWFFLEDETGTIYVDINPSGLSIPPKVGKKVVVEGVPTNRNGRISIIGKGVEF